jgi:hypothetical protein
MRAEAAAERARGRAEAEATVRRVRLELGALEVDGNGVAPFHAATAGAPTRSGRTRGPFRNRPSQV